MSVSLSNLPWYGQIGVFAALAVGGMGAFVSYYEVPARAGLRARQAELASLRVDLAAGLAMAKELAEFKARAAELESRLDSLRAALPEEKDAGDLLRRMQSGAAQSNLVIRSFAPKAISTKALHAEWPIVLELEGTYHNLAMFFDRVGRFTRIVNISGLEIRGRDNPEPNSTITATCTATAFVLLDKPALPTPGSGKPGAVPVVP